MNPRKVDAILALVPNAQVVVRGEEIEWIEPSIAPVTNDEINQKLEELLQQFDNNQYQRLRAAEYPPIEEYLDGIVKGDKAQIDSYIEQCLAVKQKYPKP